MAVSKVFVSVDFVQKTTAKPPPSNDTALFGSQPQHRDTQTTKVALQGRPSAGCHVSACSDDKGMPRQARSSTPFLPLSTPTLPPKSKKGRHTQRNDRT